MPKVELTADAVLRTGRRQREYKAGDVVERSPEWCKKWIAAGRAKPVDQSDPETAADTSKATTSRKRSATETR